MSIDERTGEYKEVYIFGAGFSKAVDQRYPTGNELLHKIRVEFLNSDKIVGLLNNDHEPVKPKEFSDDQWKLFRGKWEKFKDSIKWDDPKKKIVDVRFELIPTEADHSRWKEGLSRKGQSYRYELCDYIAEEFLKTNLELKRGLYLQSYSDIEALLYDLSYKHPFDTEEDYYKGRVALKKITDAIYKIFQNLEKGDVFEFDKLQKIYDSSINYPMPTLISFNYDLLLEKILLHLEQSESQDYEKYYPIDLSSLQSKSPSPKLCLLKLHGSLNLYYGDDDQQISNEQNIICDRPFIIPPISDKTSQIKHKYIVALWKMAYEKMLWAERICVFGYSFPLTDLTFRQLLFQSQFDVTGRRRKEYTIEIFDREPKPIKERVRQILQIDKKQADQVIKIYKCDANGETMRKFFYDHYCFIKGLNDNTYRKYYREGMS